MEKLTPLLEKLANQLGTTIDHLWQVLIKQAQISALQDCIWLLLAVIIYIIGIYTYLQMKKSYAETNYSGEVRYTHKNYFIYAKNNDFAVLPIALLILIFLIAIVISFATITAITTKLFNPEYWALQQILNKLQ